MVALVKKNLMTLFPTFVFKGTVNDMSLCDIAEKNIYALKNGGHCTNTLPGVYTTTDMLQNNIMFNDVVRLITNEVTDALNFYSIKRDSHYITNMWANISKPNERHLLHVHPNSLLSGVLYIKTPEGCGPISFSDPRAGNCVLVPDYETQNDANSSTVNYSPTKGDMLIFNSWLPHAVEIGTCESDEDRIAIAFNIMIKGLINKPTSRLVL